MEAISNGDTFLALNNYSVLVFSQEAELSVPEDVQVIKGKEDDMLCDFSLSRKTVIKEIDKIRKTKSPCPDDIY